MIDPSQLQQVQKRTLVLARINADSYSPRRWWIDDPARGYRSVLYRFRVAQPRATLPQGVIALPIERELRATTFYEKICPSFREETRRLYLANGKTVVAFTRAATPAREELPQASQRTVTLYPGSPLLDDDCSGFDLIGQLSRDMDTLIRFEAEDGFRTLVRLYGRYNLQFGSAGGQTDLPRRLTEAGEMDAELSVMVLDALFSPGAIYRFGAETQASLKELADTLSLQGEFRNLTRQKTPILKQELFLSAGAQDFRRICTSRGGTSLRPIDPHLQRLTAEVAGPETSDITPNLGDFLAKFQNARLALNRAAQTLQSNLLLGSVADWILAGSISGAGKTPPPNFLQATQDTFNRGVAQGRSTVVSTAVREQAKKLFLARLDKDLPGDDNQARRARIARLYELAEPYLCAIPVFRVNVVEEHARIEACLLLDEVLAENAPEIREQIEKGGRKANRQLQALLSTQGRIELALPGLVLPQMTLTTGTKEPLFAELTPGRVVLRGAFTEKNVEDLFTQADRNGRDVADAVFRAFNFGENILPDDQLDQLDSVIGPLYRDLEKADQQLLEQFKPLREGFDAGSRAVAGAALALGADDTRKAGGDIWERTSREAARIAISTTGARDARQIEQPYNRLLSAKVKEQTEETELDRIEAEALKLTLAALALPQDDGERKAAVETLNGTLAGCRQRLEKLDTKDLRVQRTLQALEAVRSLLDWQLFNSLETPESVEDKLGQAETGIIKLGKDVEAVQQEQQVDKQRLSALQASLSAFRQTLKELDSKESRVQRVLHALDAVERLLNGVGIEKIEQDLREGRDWLVALHEDRTERPALPARTSAAELSRYNEGRQLLLGHYLKKSDDPTNAFTGRTRFVWLSQLVMHIHGRLPMAEGRADMGNLCGLVLELVRHWHDQKKDNQVRDDFLRANPGGLPRFLPVQTLDHVRSLARGYHEQTEESRRTLRDLRNDLRGIEAALKALPEDGELVVLNLTADDFTALDWDLYPALFDAFTLQEGNGPSLIPTALLVSRSAQRWSPAETQVRLSEFLSTLDSKVHGRSYSGRCVVPPVLVASEAPEPPSEADPDQAALLVYRREAVACLQSLAALLGTLQGQLCYPVFAVGVPASLALALRDDVEQPPQIIEHSPYLLLARLCKARLPEPLSSEGTVSLPPSVLALPFTQPGRAAVEDLIDSWLGRADAAGIHRALGAGLFGWLISIVFRAEMGPGSTLGMPVSYRDVDGNYPAALAGQFPPASVNTFWALFQTAPALLGAPQITVLNGYNAGYVTRLSAPGQPRFGGWTFVPPVGGLSPWAAITTHPAVRYDGNPETLLPWLSRLLGKLF